MRKIQLLAASLAAMFAGTSPEKVKAYAMPSLQTHDTDIKREFVKKRCRFSGVIKARRAAKKRRNIIKHRR